MVTYSYMKLLFCISLIAYFLTQCNISLQPYPFPGRSASLPQELFTAIENVKISLTCTSVLMACIIKLAIFFQNTVRYEPYRVNLNLLKRVESNPTFEYCSLEIILVHILLFKNKEDIYGLTSLRLLENGPIVMVLSKVELQH